ncbi:methyltransferase family protein [Antricoccus suffuscus]|uniref:Methyltransferase family protein n=1 Tax=Antricoccus suffuscus TaxID=1629062 RepID=A0A2T1A713_9ACTN|nr:class I SAM-dependent methyltransferase [Antricoccus suffuscus]PRZ44389.1 methyltransferase family protein [Antricoccus suffuscus]
MDDATPKTRFEISRTGDSLEDYAQRFIGGYESGEDLYGEARFVDAMAKRGSRVLDAGCGTGRMAGQLSKLGHDAIGVDRSARLLEVARKYFADTTYVEADLLTVSGQELGGGKFDIIAAAGNVVPCLAPDTERDVLANLVSLLVPDGRLVLGFKTDREYSLAQLDADSHALSLTEVARFSDWQLGKWYDESGWISVILQAG